MQKVQIDHARVKIDMRFLVEGSVLAGTVKGSSQGVQYVLEVESPEPPERLRPVLRNAENGCFVLQSLKEPVQVSATMRVNGVDWEESSGQGV